MDVGGRAHGRTRQGGREGEAAELTEMLQMLSTCQNHCLLHTLWPRPGVTFARNDGKTQTNSSSFGVVTQRRLQFQSQPKHQLLVLLVFIKAP